jgi:CheY-like chemotaxis protein
MATVLIVEDEEPVREFLADLVQEAGHQALQAVHGREALAVVDAERPDLVLADAMLPILGGVDLCRRLKADPDTSSIPVVLMTSGGRRPPDQAAADAFINKPFVPEEIDAVIRRWLSTP